MKKDGATHHYMIKVYGFPRSGNHYLMELIGRNFYADQDLTSPAGKVGHWSDRQTVGPVEFGQLAGHHGPPDWGYEQGRSIYLYRDGRAVLASLFNSPHFKHAYWPMTFSEYIRAPLDWKWSVGHHAQPTQTPVEHWKEHLDAWYKPEHLLLFVRYENLVRFTPYTLGMIQYRYRLEHRAKWDIPQKLVGHFPSGGALDGWREMWNKEDTAYFFETVPRNYYGVYRDEE